MVAEQRCPECGAPVATGAPYCPNGHELAWREEPEDRTTDLGAADRGAGGGADRGEYGGADRGRYGDESLVTQRVAADEPLPRRDPAPPTERIASAPSASGAGGPGGAGVGGGLQRVNRGPNPAAIVLGVLLLGVLAAGGWYFLNARDDGAVPAGAVTTSETATVDLAPSVTATPTPSAPANETYEIQAGDSLSAIATRYGTTVEALAAENEITDINRITVGQVLVIPAETGTASP